MYALMWPDEVSEAWFWWLVLMSVFTGPLLALVLLSLGARAVLEAAWAVVRPRATRRRDQTLCCRAAPECQTHAHCAPEIPPCREP